MFGRKLPAQNVYALFPLHAEEEISLNLADTALFGDVPSATADLVSLCILARAAKPKVVFEIGTLAGSTVYILPSTLPGLRFIPSICLPSPFRHWGQP
jgi:predicted O-methyltransferase YrrM